MWKWQKLNLLGILFVLLFIVVGQLVWLFDPILKISNKIYWIEIVDHLVYLIILIPLVWLVYAVLGLKHMHKMKQEQSEMTAALRSIKQDRKGTAYVQQLLYVLKIFIATGSLASVLLLVIAPDQFVWASVIIASVLVMILLDYVLEEWQRKRGLPWKACSLIGAFFLVLAVLFYPTSYSVTHPGLVMNMNQYAQIQNKDTEGEMMGVLVFDRPAFPIDWLYASLFPHYDFIRSVDDDVSLTDQLQNVRHMQLNADQVASAIALQKGGVGEGIIFHGARITSMVEGSPISQFLHIGDVVYVVNDQVVSNVAELREYIAEKEETEVQLTIMRAGEELKVMVPLSSSHAEQDTTYQNMLGVQMIDEISMDVPMDIDFLQYWMHRGGPSHGAMLALSLMNQLTEENLTNGHVVAGTGTLETDGTVGRVGGVKQKAYSAERVGADVFFVPEAQEYLARQGAEEMTIVPVSELNDMLTWLEDNPRP